MSSKKIGLAIIGTGMAAKPHALALNELKDDINAVSYTHLTLPTIYSV